MKLRVITQLRNLANKRVLVRVDYNVDIVRGKVLDTERIERSVQTINFLAKKRAKILLLSHLGRPEGKRDRRFSLKPLVPYLRRLTKRKVFFVDDCVGSRVREAVSRMRGGDILLLENVRFYAAEDVDD